jgi:hypothetical protein
MERGNEDGEVRAADIEGPALGSNLCAT